MAVSRVQSLASRATNVVEHLISSPWADMAASQYTSHVATSAPSAVPAVLMRAGTSRGIFVHSRNLPSSKAAWPEVISAIMGSHNGDRRQLDGVGGATSTTSKAAIISPPSRPDADVDYTFAQVVVGENRVDMSGSCGNICSGVGPFALDEKLVSARGRNGAVVRVHDTNTGAIIEQTLAIDNQGRYNAYGDHRISGYSGSGSPLKMSWLNPAGTVGPRKFYPTGNAADLVDVKVAGFAERVTAEVSLIDAANPFVFVNATSLPEEALNMDHGDPRLLELVEAIRCEGAVRMGIAATIQEARKLRPIPKIALLYAPKDQSKADIRIVPYSLGKPHPSCQLTGTIALSAALSYPGTVASKLACQARGLPELNEVEFGGVHKRIAHPGGINEAEVLNTVHDNAAEIDKVSILTTAQRLFKGEAYFPRLSFDRPRTRL